MTLSHSLKRSFEEAKILLEDFCLREDVIHLTERVILALVDTFNGGGKVLICGNGGSACDSMHFAEEFTGRFRKDRRPLPVLSLTDASHITCVGNDYGFDEIFSRGVEAFGNKGDVLIVLSTSGHSKNIIRAVESAKAKQLRIIGMLGKDGGKLKNKCDFEFIVPGVTADRIQEIHMLILHCIIEGIERKLFPDHYL